jgi:hypothetical protein
MQRKRSEFVAMLIVSAVWIESGISVPIVYGLLVTGNFAVNCPSVVSGYAEHWHEYTLPRRVYTFFICVEVHCTRAWCTKRPFTALQSVMSGMGGNAWFVTICHMLTSICTTLAVDVGLFAWLFSHKQVCADMLGKSLQRTLEPLCVQTSDVDVVLEGIHLFNALCTCTIAIFVTILSCKS